MQQAVCNNLSDLMADRCWEAEDVLYYVTSPHAVS